jgi:hypothetical protein
MMDHVENIHLKHRAANERVNCDHPVCKSEDHFKNHVARVHGITLREEMYIGC